ncbi:3-hydroxyisobutyrate dehydrogenase [Pseudomonas putida]|uniref:3-hydroxyisobutyrate dehydrogenase n=2 Tax=Pseudomonas putida TaxID=303 RepID=A0A8I1JIH2_PSEPU|nr:3-hydroxyisobutyrate dehydrogenase [Pseudomonas putida]MBI6884992.1 3-hydroxyisobutyrate dehydrogenase [Pseudomonas putida]
MKKITFVGLGAMGAPMAHRLIDHGFDVTLYDVNQSSCRAFEGKQAKIAASASDAVNDADAVITMLPNDAAVADFYLGECGIISIALKKPTLIDCSTISVETTRKVARAAAASGIQIVDAPVSGGPGAAAKGSLSFMLGGSDNTVARVLPLLQPMGDKITHVGTNGCGQAAKICNNMLAAIIMAGTAEALALGVKNGLDPALLSKVIQTSSGGSFLAERWNPWPGVQADAPSSNAFQGGFQLQLMLKDLALALSCAQSTNAFTPLGSLSKNLYDLVSSLPAIESLDTQNVLRLDFSYIQTLYHAHY